MSSPKAQLELLRPWLKISDKDLKKANEDDFFGTLGKNIQSAGKQVYDAGADATKALFDTADKNRINNLAKQNPQNPELKKLNQAIKQREIDSNQRTRDLEGDKAASQGKAILLTDKPKIFKNIAKEEVKFAKETPKTLDAQGSQALSAYEKQLREDGRYSDNEVNQYVSQAGNLVKQKNSEIGKQAINDSRNLVNSLADESVGGFNIERANIGFDEAEGKKIGFKRALKSQELIETGLRTAKPIIKGVNDISNLVLSAEDQTLGRVGNLITGKGFKAGDLANTSNEYDKQILNALPSVGGQNINQAVDVEQNLGTEFQKFAGNTIPFYFTPQTSLSRGASALVGRALPKGLLRNIARAGVQEGVKDSALSIPQTLGDLNSQVLDGNITYGQALQQAPSAVTLNAVMDFGGAAAFKGAGSLIGKGFKGLNIPKAPQAPEAPTLNQIAQVAQGQALPAQAITPQQIRQNTYQGSVQKLGEISQRNKTLTQELKQAELTGDYATAARLKAEAKINKAQTKFLKQTVKNLELKGLEEQAQIPTNQAIPETPTAQALPSNSGLSQTASDVVLDLKDKLAEKRMSINDRLAEVGGEKLLLSERSQKRVAKLEKEANEIELAIRKYEGVEQTNLKSLNAQQKAQALADQIKANQSGKVGTETTDSPLNNLDDLIPFDLSNVKQRRKLSYDELRRVESLNKDIKRLSIEASAIKQGRKTWSGKTAADLPKIEAALNKYKTALKKLNNPQPNQTINQTEIPSTPQKTVSEVNQVPSVLTPNKSASVLTPPSAKALPEVQAKTGMLPTQEPQVKAPETPKIESESVKNSTQNLNAPEIPKVKGLKGSLELNPEDYLKPAQTTDNIKENIHKYISSYGKYPPFASSKILENLNSQSPVLAKEFLSKHNIKSPDELDQWLKSQYSQARKTYAQEAINNAKEGKKLKQDIKNRPKKGSPEALIEEAIKQNKAFNAQFNDPLTNSGSKTETLEPQGLKATETPKIESESANESLRKAREIDNEYFKNREKIKNLPENVSYLFDGEVYHYERDNNIVIVDRNNIELVSFKKDSNWKKKINERIQDISRVLGSEKDLTKTKEKLDKQHQDLLRTVEPEVKTPVSVKTEAPKPKSTGAKRVENPAIEESQTVPKLGTKKVINPDGTERIARTLGDYKAVEFQEIARRPDKLNKLSDISEAVSKTDEEAIDVIADLAKEKKTFENTLVDLSEALETKLKQKGIDPETYSYKGIQLFPTKGTDSLSLNTKGQKILNRYERMLDRLGLGERVAKSDVNSLSVQTNIGKASNAKVGAQNSIDDLAEQWIKTKGDLLKSDKQFKTAKDVFMAKTGSKLDNGGLDHVWKNEKGDTAFHISRAKSEFKGEAQDLLTTRREQLKQRQDTGRTIKGKMETKLKDPETGKAITAASKKFKTVYQELQERLDNKTAENLATERSPDLTNNTNQATEFLLKDASENKALDTDLINEATTNTKKLNKQFAFNPAAIPVIGVIAKKIIEGNGFADTLELALNILPINKAFDKLTKNAKLANMKTAALELVFNTPKTIDQNILSVKRQANQKFIDGFNKLEARKMLYETKLADKSEDVYKEIQDILNNKNVDEILDAEGNIRPEFENSKAAEALAELADRQREMVEYAEDFKDDLVEKINSFNTKIDKLENQPKTASVKRAIEELKTEKFDLEKTLIAVDNKIGSLKTITGNGLFQNIQSMAYKGALLWNPSSAFLNLFDYVNVRSAPELQTSKGFGRLANAIPFLGDVDRALYQILGQKLHFNKNSLLHFMTADKKGSYYNVMSNASQSRKAGKNVGEWLKNSWQKIEDLNPNKLIAHFYQDVTVVASARSWKAEHPEFKNLPDPVTNFRAFKDKAPKEAVLSFMTKMNIDLGLIAGRGSKGADFALGGLGSTELGKAFTPFLKPVYRISNSLQRASTDMLDGLNGFKKLDNGTYQFDINKVDSDKALKGISSLIANIGGTYLVGGSAALVGLPAVGMAMNFLVRNFVPEEEREDFKDKFNQTSLANKKLLPGFGERLQIQQRGFGEKDSIVGMLTNRFKTLGQPLLASYIQDIGKVTNMTFEALQGEEEVDKEKLLKVWLKVLPTGQLFNKVIAYFNDQEKKVYDLDGAFPKEIGSVKTKGDLRLVVGGGNEEIENIKQSDRLKQRAKSNIQNLNFTGRPGYVTPKFTTEGLKRFRADIDRYMKLNPTADRNEVESKLIAQAKKKWLDKHPELKKPTKQKKDKSLVYSMEGE